MKYAILFIIFISILQAEDAYTSPSGAYKIIHKELGRYSDSLIISNGKIEKKIELNYYPQEVKWSPKDQFFTISESWKVGGGLTIYELKKTKKSFFIEKIYKSPSIANNLSYKECIWNITKWDFKEGIIHIECILEPGGGDGKFLLSQTIKYRLPIYVINETIKD